MAKAGKRAPRQRVVSGCALTTRRFGSARRGSSRLVSELRISRLAKMPINRRCALARTTRRPRSREREPRFAELARELPKCSSCLHS